MPTYQYRCPIHGVIDRREQAVGDSFLRCPNPDSGQPCGKQLIVIRAVSSREQPFAASGDGGEALSNAERASRKARWLQARARVLLDESTDLRQR
jgi:hypothetical protein